MNTPPDAPPASSRRRRSGGRSARTAAPPPQAGLGRPYIQRKLGTFNVLETEGLELIERNANILLRETGMDFVDDPEILEIFKTAGADVAGTRVRFEPDMCRQVIQATAPREFRQVARNGEKSVVLGGANTVLCPSWGPPFVHDLDRGRRYAGIEDFRSLVKLHHMNRAPAPFRRRGVRAGGSAGQQTASGHALHPYPLF